MDLHTIDIILSIVFGLASIPIGLYFGALPMKSAYLTNKQQSISSALGIAVTVIIIAQIFTNMNISSWVFLVGIILFFAIGKIPAIHNWFIKKWPQNFAPRKKPRR